MRLYRGGPSDTLAIGEGVRKAAADIWSQLANGESLDFGVDSG